MTTDEAAFDEVRVRRGTGETQFEIVLGPRKGREASLPVANRVLSHLLDHLCKSAGLGVALGAADWPGSWKLDHVLCEDMGQLIGRGVAAIHDQRAASYGVPGRASATVCMDDALVEVVLSLEARPRVEWSAPSGLDVVGFVDAWYGEDGEAEGWCAGTNLQQCVEGFAYGSGATIAVTVRRGGNLHHLYEAVFRALGDAIGDALGIPGGQRVQPGDTSGLAGVPRYTVGPGA